MTNERQASQERQSLIRGLSCPSSSCHCLALSSSTGRVLSSGLVTGAAGRSTCRCTCKVQGCNSSDAPWPLSRCGTAHAHTCSPCQRQQPSHGQAASRTTLKLASGLESPSEGDRVRTQPAFPPPQPGLLEQPQPPHQHAFVLHQAEHSGILPGVGGPGAGGAGGGGAGGLGGGGGVGAGAGGPGGGGGSQTQVSLSVTHAV